MGQQHGQGKALQKGPGEKSEAFTCRAEAGVKVSTLGLAMRRTMIGCDLRELITFVGVLFESTGGVTGSYDT